MEIKCNVNKLPPVIIEDIRFSGEGCAISRASASLLTEKVKGTDSDTVLHMDVGDILTLIGTPLTPSRTKCALLPLEVLQKAIIKISHLKK
jgi:nitrogen fixation NifU-like protein